MVDVTTKVVTPGERMNARMQRMREKNAIPGVRVVPADGEGFTADDMRRLLRHPRAGGFRETGSIEWPNDTFTHRRLVEGSIKLADESDENNKQPSRSTKTEDSAA